MNVDGEGTGFPWASAKKSWYGTEEEVTYVKLADRLKTMFGGEWAVEKVSVEVVSA